jgi:atypical dual specificity phosphatase
VLLDPFTWIVADQVGACAYPIQEADWAMLREQRIALLVNLHTRAHAPSTLAQRGLEQVHLPVADLQPPSAEQIELGLRAIDRALEQGRRVAVHCGAGLGRTGTLLACYLIRGGLGPGEAIARLRALRPGCIETTEQEQAVYAYAARHSS